MVCVFCSAHVDTRDEAIDAGWRPDFFAGADEYEGPVCRACTGRYLTTSADGETELRPGIAVPPLAIPLRHRRND